MAKGNDGIAASRLALGAGVAALIYAISFVFIIKVDTRLGNGLSAALLMVGGVLVSAVNVALYERLKGVYPALAVWALAAGSFCALGSVVHGGYDLANTFHQPHKNLLNIGDYPNSIDPRGVLTFGVSGLVTAAWTWLIARSGRYPANFITLGWVLAVLLGIIYLMRLIVLDPDNPLVLVPAALAGFIIGPLWYIWLGRLWRNN